jgi:hypothetical protein
LFFVVAAFVCTALAGVKSDAVLIAFLIITFILTCCGVCWGGIAISSRAHCFGGNSYIRSRNVCISSFVWFIALIVGIIAASAWFTPWWFVTRGGKVYDVDAAATSWIASNTLPDYGNKFPRNLTVPVSCTKKLINLLFSGIYHFSQSASSGTAAFINQAKAGAFSGQVGFGLDWFCVAPIVTSWNQTKVVFWAADTGCCSQSEVTCWLKFNSPGSAAISASLKAPLRFFDVFEKARFASCSNLAVNTSISAWALCSLPVVYLDVASSTTAEDTVNYNLLCGLLFTCLIAILWPYSAYFLLAAWAECDCRSPSGDWESAAAPRCRDPEPQFIAC